MELTDFEICKRIAEIENRNPTEVTMTALPSGEKSYHIEADFEEGCEQDKFDPINDDELCFQLMIKHKVKFVPEYDGSFVVWVMSESFSETKRTRALNKNPNKAICLAIIKANEPN